MPVRLDDATVVRSGEELPVASLETYLRKNLTGYSGPIVVEQFAHGHSNLTYLVRTAAAELVLRRGPFGNQVKSAHDMGREFRVLAGLCNVYPAAPRPFLYCDDPGVLGAPFYLMERRRGIILRRELPEGVALEPAALGLVSTALIDHLARLHALDPRTAGLETLGRPEGYASRQVSGWIERYMAARTEHLPALERAAHWLSGRVPRRSAVTLVHNDYKYDNIMLSPEDPYPIVAVLDWEMATQGDPLMDLGTTLGYWVEASDPPALRLSATGPTALPGNLTRRELAERYAEQTGCDLSELLFYYVFGLFKIAVIVQQIYARYVRGQTRDRRFARLNELVAVLADQSGRALESGRV